MATSMLLLALALAAGPADAGTSAPSPDGPDPVVAPATPARGKGPETLPFGPDTIRELVRAKQPEIERCWEQLLAGQDKPKDGKLQTHFVITPLGTVKDARVVKKGTTLKSPELHRCVTSVLSTLVFPKPGDSKDHPVEYPFNLKAVH